MQSGLFELYRYGGCFLFSVNFKSLHRLLACLSLIHPYYNNFFAEKMAVPSQVMGLHWSVVRALSC